MEVGHSEVRTPSYLQQVALALAGPGVEASWKLWVRGGPLQLLEMCESLILQVTLPVFGTVVL